LASDEKEAWKFLQGKLLMNIELYLRQSCSRIPSSNIKTQNKVMTTRNSDMVQEKKCNASDSYLQSK
jgi:hypothetical protein